MASHRVNTGGQPEVMPVDRVANWLREQILSGRLAPGTWIRQHEVAEECGTSRIPVRDALHRLQAEGLVTVAPRARAWIAEFNVESLTEIYELRERIEPLAIAKSMPKLTDADFAALEEMAAAMVDAAADGDASRWVSLDRDFHLRILSHAPERYLAVIEPLWNATQHYRRTFFFLPERVEGAHREHERLLDALRRRSAEDAESLLHVHIRRTRRTLEDGDGDAAG